MTDDLYRIFSKRSAKALASDLSLGKESYFRSLDDVKSRLIKEPHEAIRLLQRLPGLGNKGVLEIYQWATGQRELPRSKGSLLREQQRADAKHRRIETLRQQVERAQSNIKAWNNELYDLGYRPPNKFR